MGKKKSVTDHLGIGYNSITELCNHYGISTRLYYDRLSRGFSQKQALGLEEKKKQRLYTKEELIQLYNLTDEQIDLALTLGLSGQQVRLLSLGRLSIDHKGNIYNSFNDMCKAWNKNTSTVKSRLKRGLSLSEALKK